MTLVAALTVALAGTSVAWAVTGRDTAPRHDAKRHVHVKPSSTTTSPSSTVPTTVASTPVPAWRVAWGVAMAWGYGNADDVTVRQLAQVGIGGRSIRVRISNAFGNQPLVVASATVGVAMGARGAVVAGSLEPLTFGGQPSLTVPVGQVAYSDPVPMRVHALETLAISVFVPGPELVTLHPCCTAGNASFFTANGGGNVTTAVSASAFPYASPWSRWVDAVDVLTAAAKGSVIALGDSITDGYHTSIRWTNILQSRIDLLPRDERVAIVNEGISANTLTDTAVNFSHVGGGPPGLDRLEQDALSQSGVSTVVLFLGTNDLYFGATAQQVIAGYEQAIAEVHQAGIRIIGVTIIPRAGSEGWNPTKEAYRQQINHWIRTSGAFDAVIDFSAVVHDVFNGGCDPEVMLPAYDSGDHVHPGPAGQTAMADSVNTTLFGIPQAPLVPELVTAIPTTGCAAAAAGSTSSSGASGT